MRSDAAVTPVQPGQPAPPFTLPAADGSGTISLAHYRDKSTVFLALFIGLWCPFCRRAIAQAAGNEAALKAVGVETLGVVATPPANAQLYFKFRPSRLQLASDPDLTTHRAYGLPKPEPTPEFMKALETTPINPGGVLPKPVPAMEAIKAVAALDGYEENETDKADMQRQWPQLKGQFLIDKHGIVRWVSIECSEGVTGLGKFPTADEIISAVRAM
jgi:peroxiredoxin